MPTSNRKLFGDFVYSVTKRPPVNGDSGHSNMDKCKCDSCWSSEPTISHVKNKEQRLRSFTVLALARACVVSRLAHGSAVWSVLTVTPTGNVLLWVPGWPGSSKTNQFAWIWRAEYLTNRLLRFSVPYRCFLLALHQIDIWTKPKRFIKLVHNLIEKQLYKKICFPKYW